MKRVWTAMLAGAAVAGSVLYYKYRVNRPVRIRIP